MGFFNASSLFTWIMAACGPIYGNPQGQPPPPQQQPTQVSGPPGGDQDPWTDPERDPRVDPPDPRPEPRPEPPPEPRADPRPEPPRPQPRPEPRPEPRPQPGLSADSQTLLTAHNKYRAQHCAAPLTWSPKLEQFAQQWANSLRDQGCKFGHSNGQFGENLAAGTSGTLDGNAVTDMWYEEIKDYQFDRGGFSMNTGHFTQVVWKGSTQLGCAKTTCRGMDIWVCEYDPPGNVDRGYRNNVLPQSCSKSR